MCRALITIRYIHILWVNITKIDYYCLPEEIIVSEFPVFVEPRFDFRILRVIVLAPGRRT